uniref:Promiscuous sugar phosphatase YidA, haloacid dehalogenase-like phosphatase family n=1 Tax=Loigolactobacillus rennini TaxID=238013 RepID=A0A1K2I4Y4_9LACO|nr:Promiscuous sugar phosphatase YidA, haloacid dehalogenase-like phosphatase family [Loigolactobacillus rennini]
MIKIIAIDIDKTLLTSANQLAPATIATIKAAQQQGVKVVLCTGRPMAGVAGFLKQLGLADLQAEYVITFNGASVATTAGQLISETGLNYDDYIDLEALSRRLGVYFQIENNQRLYTANRDLSKYTIYEANLVSLQIAYRTPEEMRQVTMPKAMLVDEPERLTAALAQKEIFQPLQQRFNFMHSAPFFLEVTKKGVNKGAALAILAKHLGLTAENVMAIGDQGNDLSMIKYAGTGVAMGNAITAIKEAAQYVTADNDHDGVAKAIEKSVLVNH